MDQSLCDLLEPEGALSGQTGVRDEQREVGDRRFGQVSPVGHCGLQAVEDALIARAGRHLRKDDEDQLVERVVLVIQQRRVVALFEKVDAPSRPLPPRPQCVKRGGRFVSYVESLGR